MSKDYGIRNIVLVMRSSKEENSTYIWKQTHVSMRHRAYSKDKKSCKKDLYCCYYHWYHHCHLHHHYLQKMIIGSITDLHYQLLLGMFHSIYHSMIFKELEYQQRDTQITLVTILKLHHQGIQDIK